MKKQENQIKTTLNQISVPHSTLDAIIDDAFQGEKVRKKKWIIPVAKYTAAIVLVSILTFSSTLASPTFAKFVTQIPVIGSVFNYFVFEKAYYDAYNDLSTDIGIVEESNGIEMIIDQAIYDGNIVTLSFIIRSEGDFGSLPNFGSIPIVQGQVFSNTGYDVEYEKGVGYVGIMRLAMFEENRETVNILWEPKSISSDNKTVKGNWTFKFSLKEIPKINIPINQEVSNNGITVRLIDAIKTDINFSINYSQLIDTKLIDSSEYVEAELFAVDNIGNEYEVPYNGGKGIVGSASREDILWNATIHGLDKEATSITFYPFAHVSNSRVDFDPITVNLK
ncbi:DUF4179 domain-containing protein [Cytobacillus depressus]|nr:DUF4179 domain-containing protein [Cytobacillus depressus]